MMVVVVIGPVDAVENAFLQASCKLNAMCGNPDTSTDVSLAFDVGKLTVLDRQIIHIWINTSMHSLLPELIHRLSRS